MPVGRRLLMRRMLRRIAPRFRDESGIGLIELLIALTILTVAIGALLAVFASSLASLQHSGKEGTAITLADRQLERYRSMPFECIPNSFPFTPPLTCGTYPEFPDPYAGSQTILGADSPDLRSYTVTTVPSCADGTDPCPAGNPIQIKVTVALTSGGPDLGAETSFFSDVGTSSS